MARALRALKDEDEWEPSIAEKKIMGGKSPSKRYIPDKENRDENPESPDANKLKEIEELKKEVVRIQQELRKRGVVTLPNFEKRFLEIQVAADRADIRPKKKRTYKARKIRVKKIWQTRAMEVTKMLFESPDSLHFRSPVDHVRFQIPKYPLIIKEPMDLGTITARIKKIRFKKHYPTAAEWARSVRLVFKNAMLFNGSHHIVHMLAVRHINEFNRLLEIYKDDIGVEAEEAIDILKLLKKIQAPFPRFKEACKILGYFLSHPKTTPFLTPVNSQVIKRYKEVVHRPRDLSLIRMKMRQYTEFDQFKEDLRLVFSNAMLFNAHGSLLYMTALSLLEEFEGKLEELERPKVPAKEVEPQLWDKEAEPQLKTETKGKEEEEAKLEKNSKAKEDEPRAKHVLASFSNSGCKKVKAPASRMKKTSNAKKHKKKKKRASRRKKKKNRASRRKKKATKRKRTRKTKEKKVKLGRRSKRVKNQ